MNQAKQYRRELLRQFFRGNHLRFFAEIILSIIYVMIMLAVSWLMQQLTDTAIGKSSAFSLGQLAVIAAAIAGYNLIHGAMERQVLPAFVNRAMGQYRSRAFELLTKKSISTFSGENSALYISALSNDVNTIETGYISRIFSIISNILQFAGALVLMLIYSPELTAAAMVLTIFPLAVSMLVGNRAAGAEAEVSRKNESFLAMVKDAITGFSVIKTFRAEKQMIGQFKAGNDNLSAAKIRRGKIEITIDAISSFAYIATQFGVFIIGAYLTRNGYGMSPGKVIAFVNLMNNIISPIGALPRLFANRKAAMALVEKLANALAENVRDDENGLICSADTAIEISGLEFSYGGGKKVLDGLSARFEAGKSYAIVGASGCGKSTLLNILMAGQENYAGKIMYDGVDLREISGSSLYEKVSLIQQNVFVFSGTIRENITMFGNFSDDAVENAAYLSGLDGLISEKGWDYMCGENGCNLSGGEKQRISIARSLLRKSSVLLVDEATASLDSETAAQVSESILNLKGITRVVVTHSLDAGILSRFDSILVLKNGRTGERGTFSELMDKRGYFYSLYTVSQ